MRLFGPLPRDCWELIGTRCNITVQFKIAATCRKLYSFFFQRYNLDTWLKIITEENWSFGLVTAAEDGRRGLADFFVSKGAFSWNWALSRAATCGHLDFVDYLISKYTIVHWDWDWALHGAAKCKDSNLSRHLVDFFISKGANNWDWGFDGAKKGGHQDLIDFFISKGAKS